MTAHMTSTLIIAAFAAAALNIVTHHMFSRHTRLVLNAILWVGALFIGLHHG